ncbi:MAG: hypothetical protein JO097_15290 [Acidobacteriaceae bacterium]|nr:hypothetical protein [Acidobacteriaceae bacterium]MBV9297305.1 hypothetical protein [Acidobacteriaceae bacterium]MBV9763784.1 hypothetical protein [Acidobacteriaceae bacterium]
MSQEKKGSRGITIIQLAAIGAMFGICGGSALSHQLVPSDEQDEQKLIVSRDTQDIKAIRDHAWQLFESITNATNGNAPAWDNWNSAYDVLRGHLIPRNGVHEFEIPRQLLAGAQAKSLSIKFSKAQPLQEVIYNPELAAQIVSLGLYDHSKLQSLNGDYDRRHTAPSERNVPPVGRHSIALKLIWLVIPAGETAGEVGHRPLDAFPAPAPQKDYDILACVEADDSVSDAPKCPKLNENQVSLSAFYHHQIADSERQFLINDIDAELSKQEQHLLYEAPLLNLLQSNSKLYAVLIGFHVATKEIPDWTWTTFWWHPGPLDASTQEYVSCRPPHISHPWNNYLMDATLSMLTPYSKLKPQLTPKICFNPYLEGQQAGGTQANCMSCHRQAAFPVAWKLPKPGEYWSGDQVLFLDNTKTDYLWSLARGATDRVPTKIACPSPSGVTNRADRR